MSYNVTEPGETLITQQVVQVTFFNTTHAECPIVDKKIYLEIL